MRKEIFLCIEEVSSKHIPADHHKQHDGHRHRALKAGLQQVMEALKKSEEAEEEIDPNEKGRRTTFRYLIQDMFARTCKEQNKLLRNDNFRRNIHAPRRISVVTLDQALGCDAQNWLAQFEDVSDIVMLLVSNMQCTSACAYELICGPACCLGCSGATDTCKPLRLNCRGFTHWWRM